MWDVETMDTFDAWLELQSRALKEDMLIMMLTLSEFGPQLGRPCVDAVKDSTSQNIKELRVQHYGLPIRALSAFDPLRKVIVSCAGNKDDMDEKRFYKEMITLVDRESSQYLTKERQ